MKYIVIFGLCGFMISPMLLAGKQEDLLQLAYEQAQTAYVTLEKRELDCKEAEKNKIPVKKLLRFSITKSQWELALLHLHSLAHYRCVAPWWDKTIVALTRYFWLEKIRTGENKRWIDIPPLTPNQSQTRISPDELYDIFYDNQQDLEAEYRFLKLPADIRHLLLVAPEFQKPFDFDHVLRWIRKK